MINALWSSREGGAKRFLHGSEKVHFGWQAIIDMWDRERSKRDHNQICLVPGMIQAYVERDAWTKLNVKPAKLMQVVISL